VYTPTATCYRGWETRQPPLWRTALS
jgi:hypothetical protein